MDVKHVPEGYLADTRRNRELTQSIEELIEAKNNDVILEGKATMYDAENNLIVELKCGTGIIPHDEGSIDGSTTRDIALMSRVGRNVAFKVSNITIRGDGQPPQILLSRRAAQDDAINQYINCLQAGDIIDARITHLDNHGAWCDIACGVVALIPMSSISISHISNAQDRFYVGQDIHAVVKSAENPRRVCLSHKELLGTWNENILKYKVGETVIGIVRNTKDDCVFIELKPNLVGAAEKGPVSYHNGDIVSVMIKSIIPENLKIKLNLVDKIGETIEPLPFKYYITSGNLAKWRYTPDSCSKTVETVFYD